MPLQVCMGAMMTCSFGATPAPITVLPVNKVFTMTPDANINDHVPITNIPTFGMCSAPTNPEVISATAAALGVFTPMPCVPATPAPWIPTNTTVILGGVPALDNGGKLMCTWLGVITFEDAGEETVNIP
jgi:hypothetical protein